MQDWFNKLIKRITKREGKEGEGGREDGRIEDRDRDERDREKASVCTCTCACEIMLTCVFTNPSFWYPPGSLEFVKVSGR